MRILFRNHPPTVGDLAKRSEALEKTFARLKARARRLQDAELQRYIDGDLPVERLKEDLEYRQKRLPMVEQRAEKYQKGSERWSAQVRELSQRSKKSARAIAEAVRKASKYKQSADEYAKVLADMKAEVEWLQLQLRKIEEGKRAKEGQGNQEQEVGRDAEPAPAPGPQPAHLSQHTDEPARHEIHRFMEKAGNYLGDRVESALGSGDATAGRPRQPGGFLRGRLHIPVGRRIGF